jgi:ABC-type branched-subunit amino acid transport system ATPase component
MTVTENMLIADDNRFGEKPFSSLFKPKKNKEIEKNRIEKMKCVFIKLFGEDNEFWEKRKDLASSLSYGQQRLLSLARIFMSKYKIVLLDEPTAGVNPKIINKICAIIRKMPQKDGLTVLLIEHNMKVVENVADWCCFMSDGYIAAVGSPQDVIGNPNVRKTYMGI